MRFRVSAIALGLGALAATPCLALTIQAAPPRPDVAEHLRPTTGPGPRVLPSPDDLKTSFLASGRPQLGQGYAGAASGGTMNFSLGPLHATTTVAPGYGAFWNDTGPRDNGNPWSLVPPRR